MKTSKTHHRSLPMAVAGCVTLLLTACTTTAPGPHPQESAIKARAASLDAREAELKSRESSIAASAAAAPSMAAEVEVASAKNELLPPGAKPGECYARVWVEPQYRTLSEEVLVADAGERIAVIAPEYATVEETVLVAEASSRLETIPATYATVSEQKLIQEASRTWRVDLGGGAPPASQDLLDAAAAAGIDLQTARAGQCFHEHYRPATFEKTAEQVLVAEGHELIETAAAEYRWVEKQVLVREASKRLEDFDAVYKTTTERVIDVPAHTIWKKGTGPIQRIDAATGEIMCLVEVPETYKTISKKVLVTPAGTREVEIPAEYKTVRVQELARAAEEHRRTVEPKYDQVYVTTQTGDASFVWHEVHNTTEPATTRTGKKICLTESPARYATVKRQVVKTPAQTRTIEIPAKYETVKVKKLMAEAREVRSEIPAVYRTVTHQELEQDGRMEWRSILCETNMTVATISDIQRKLKAAGYNPGAVDGVIGRSTMDAVNRFQRDKSLPVDRYLNIETIRALDVAI